MGSSGILKMMMPWSTVAIVLMLSCTVQGRDNETKIIYIPRGDPERNVEYQLEKAGNVMCYECSSWTHPLCEDPFNFTLSIEKGPPIYSCDGCCVKLVQHLGTPYASIRRTCTEKLQINLFVVDHVCMMEGGGRGRMCFCEEDLCNAAPSSLRPSSTSSASFFLFILLPLLVHALLAWEPR